MSTHTPQTPHERILVQLSCGWCGRGVENLKGERDPKTGQVLLNESSAHLKMSGGRPFCAACGGPMFLEDWRPEYELPKLDAAAFEDSGEGAKTAPAA